MSPLELAIVVGVVLWALRRLVVDASLAVRGITPPSLRGRGGGSRGMRGYVSDVWADAWESARQRRRQRRERRAERDARQGRGPVEWGDSERGGHWRDPLSARLRDRWHSALDRAADRVEARRERRQRPDGDTGRGGRGGPGGEAGRRAQDLAAGRTGPDPGTGQDTDRPDSGAGEPVTRPADGGQDTDRAGEPDADRQPETSTEPDRRGDGDGDRGDDSDSDSEHQRQTGDAGAGARVISFPAGGRAGRDMQDRDETRGEDDMSEVTGLTSAQTYVGQMRTAMEGSVSGAEQYVAAVQGGGVTGPAVDSAHRAMELQQQAAQAWAEAETELSRHMQVREAYEANQGAGSREFVTSE